MRITKSKLRRIIKEATSSNQITQAELKQILDQHSLWVESLGSEGVRASLQGADLQGTDLEDTNLQRADLQGANLQDASLQDADLQDANLQGVNLKGANLQRAYLPGAYLQGADLQDANLPGVDLEGANLQGANLLGANLHPADFSDADLRDAKFDINIRDCYTFWRAKFTPDALPWLILHPRWSEFKDTVQIEGMTSAEVSAYDNDSGSNTSNTANPVTEARLRAAIRRELTNL